MAKIMIDVNYSYKISTRIQNLPPADQVIMVDGTIPKWVPRAQDLHFDHHRPGGAPVQLFEIPDSIKISPTACFTSTQVDADLIVATVLLQLRAAGYSISIEILRRLEAIAWDCDHLAVPGNLQDLAQFAASAVAALKSGSEILITHLGLPRDRRAWSPEQKEEFASAAFKEGVEWILMACKGERPWPGEMGEADKYWEEVKKTTQMLIEQRRVAIYRDALIFDGKGLGGKYVDPRCFLEAAKELQMVIGSGVTLTQREVVIQNVFKGYSYTLGVVPLHPRVSDLDYTKGVFEALSSQEKAAFEKLSKEGKKPDNPPDGWGGRQTVGGSGWNSPSLLEPEKVIDIVLSVIAVV